MKNQTETLKFVVCIIVVLAITTLINDIIDFDFLKYQTFEIWKLATDEKRGGFSQDAVQYGFYIAEIILFAFKIYLIYGIAQLFFLLKNVEKELYFIQKNIDLFKKMGNIFKTYVINVFILKAVLSYIAQERHFKVMQLISNELILLFAGALAFYVLAIIFERAKALQEENDLTV